MLNRRVFVLIVVFILCVGFLGWTWQEPEKLPLSSAETVVSDNRWILDLSGDWQQFFSLRQAWAAEERRLEEKQSRISFLNGSPVFLPSNAAISLVSRSFNVPGEWSARTSMLEFSGLRGRVRMYLNGIGGENLLAEFEGSGALDQVEILSAMLRYGTENILIIQLQTPTSRRLAVGGGIPWPDQGRLSGRIALVGVRQPMIAAPTLSFDWQEDQAEVLIQSHLLHYGNREFGPWEVTAEIMDETTMIAQADQILQADGNLVQTVNIRLPVPQARLWNPQDPYRYQLRLKVVNALGDQDDIVFSFGLRRLEKAQDQWLLNGEGIKIQGAALSAVQEYRLRAEERVSSWLQEQKEKGINLIYFSDGFPDESWLQAADRLGMGVWAEWPVRMIPGSQLDEVALENFQEQIRTGTRHPCLWAWTVSKALDAQMALSREFEREALAMIPEGQLAYVMEQAVAFSNEAFTGAWGEILPPAHAAGAVWGNGGWFQEKYAAAAWALLSFFIFLKCVFSVSWRYREINESKPKRQLRWAWVWYGTAFLLREGTLAGILTSLIFRAPSDISVWLTDYWPVLTMLQRQNPWLLWLTLAVLLALLRLLQIGSAAAALPGAPRAMGLVYWMERRYFWAFIVAILWAVSFWQMPFYVAFAAYLALTILFLPVRIRDVRRAGGSYLPFLVLPGALTAALLVWLISRWPDLVFIFHLWGWS
ncbi:MAG: glycosyl hydrolase [Peptococcaceae bacterium]|jgi:hypothetical protein|nr:glycosyl hydrolase [Peptococcaceae bacterium]